jgi:hypothetical protein
MNMLQALRKFVVERHFRRTNDQWFALCITLPGKVSGMAPAGRFGCAKNPVANTHPLQLMASASVGRRFGSRFGTKNCSLFREPENPGGPINAFGGKRYQRSQRPRPASADARQIVQIET